MYEPTLWARFWAKVTLDGECWVWTAALDKVSGYGRFQVNKSSQYAHRVAYSLMTADIPPGLQLDHICRNRACVNPYHLEPVTPVVNTRRSPIAHGNETHCPDGHPYEGDNLIHWRGRRICKACRYAANRRWRAARNKAA